MEGKPSSAKKKPESNLWLKKNQQKKKKNPPTKQAQSALAGRGEAEVGRHFEDKHCRFGAVGEVYLMCSCWPDKWTLTGSFRGVGVPGPAAVEWS